jgi:hypothetical protein
MRPIELFGSEWEIFAFTRPPIEPFPWLDGPHAIRFSKTEEDFGECLFGAPEAKDETGWPDEPPLETGRLSV